MDKKVVSIQSLNRTAGTSNDFTITDPNEHFINQPKSAKASLICIPYTWYNVSAIAGNAFSWNGDASGAHSIVVPSNNYTGDTLADELQTQMNAEAAPETYTVVYDTTTNKFMFSATENFTIDFTIADNLHSILGFEDGIVTPNASTVTSTNIAGFVLDKSVWVCTDMIRGIDNGIIPWTGDNPPNEYNVLAEVPITGCFNSILMYSPPADLPFFPITNSDFSLVDRTTQRTTRFFLRFPSGTEVDLNGQDWSIQIVFDFNKPVSGLAN